MYRPKIKLFGFLSVRLIHVGLAILLLLLFALSIRQIGQANIIPHEEPGAFLPILRRPGSVPCAGRNRQGVVGGSPMQTRNSEPVWPRVMHRGE